MGWAYGSQLAEDIWSLVRNYIPVEDRVIVARKFKSLFESFDCDTMYECRQLEADTNLLYWNEDISQETKKRLEDGEVFTLLDENLKPYSYVCMDSNGNIREKRIEISEAD
jgi:hypothetical protein